MAKNKHKSVAQATTTQDAESQNAVNEQSQTKVDAGADVASQAEPKEKRQLTQGEAKHAKRQEKLAQKKLARQREQKKSKTVEKNGQKQPKTSKAKEVTGELKKVTWPTFGAVVKNTLLVLGIVILITLGLFVVDRIFSWLYQLIVDGAVTNWWN